MQRRPQFAGFQIGSMCNRLEASVFKGIPSHWLDSERVPNYNSLYHYCYCGKNDIILWTREAMWIKFGRSRQSRLVCLELTLLTNCYYFRQMKLWSNRWARLKECHVLECSTNWDGRDAQQILLINFNKQWISLITYLDITRKQNHSHCSLWNCFT